MASSSLPNPEYPLETKARTIYVDTETDVEDRDSIPGNTITTFSQLEAELNGIFEQTSSAKMDTESTSGEDTGDDEPACDCIDKPFSCDLSATQWRKRRQQIISCLNNMDLKTSETNKHTFFDPSMPYTRNLVVHNDNYTVLLLCWNPGQGSKIHNHPCDGCFVKTLRGCVKESLYNVNEESNSIDESDRKFYLEGQVSYMSDQMGKVHSISNPNKEVGAVSLHLYTPPFKNCKVWNSCGAGQYNNHNEATVGFFSVYGHRTPQQKKSVRERLLDEIRAPFMVVI